MSTKVQNLVEMYRKAHNQTPPDAWIMARTGLSLEQVRAALAASESVTNGPSLAYRPVAQKIEPLVHHQIQSAPETVTKSHDKPEVVKSTGQAPATLEKPASRDKVPWWKRLPSLESLVLRFAHSLQYFGFLTAGIVDLGLSMYFWRATGSNDFSRNALMAWGLVQVSAKLWGWAYQKVHRGAAAVAIFAAILSAFGNAAILRAEFELQAREAIAVNTEITAESTQKAAQKSEVDVINEQIAAKIAEVKTKESARDKIDSTVEENLPMYRTLEGFVSKANNELTQLRKDLVAAQDRETKAAEAKKIASVTMEITKVEKPKEMVLDVWSIFQQWVSLDFFDAAKKPQTLSWFFTLAAAILLELIVFATTPRKEKLK